MFIYVFQPCIIDPLNLIFSLMAKENEKSHPYILKYFKGEIIYGWSCIMALLVVPVLALSHPHFSLNDLSSVLMNNHQQGPYCDF